jgi:hypothetical protein
LPFTSAIALLHLVLAHQRMQRAQRRRLACNQQQPARIAIEAMHEFQALLIRARSAQRLDDAEAHAAATMDGNPGGLVDHQQLRVLVDDGGGDALEQRTGGAARWRRRTDPNRRYAHGVACLQPALGLGALAVDAHLALANHAENMGLGHISEDAGEEVVQSLALPPLVDLDLADLGAGKLSVLRRLWRVRRRGFVTSCFH